MQENILYSFRRCPYAIRARWALVKANIPITIREIDLKNKPNELIDISQKSTVPVLLLKSGKVLDESIDIIRWALENSNIKNPLKESINQNFSDENFKIINENDGTFKYNLDRFKYASRYNIKDPSSYQKKAKDILFKWNCRILENSNKDINGWLNKKCESILDWSIWPFVRQYLIADPNLFINHNELEPMQEWLNYFINQSTYNEVMKKHKKWDPI